MTMFRSRKRNLLCLAAGLVVSLVLAYLFFCAGPAVESLTFQDGWMYYTGPLLPGQSVGQTFYSKAADLARIDVRLANYRRPLVKGVALHLVEVDRTRSEEVSRPMPAGEGGELIELHDGLQIGQSFIPRLDGLSGIWLAVDSRRLLPGAEVRLRLWPDAPASGQAGPTGLPLAKAQSKAAEMPERGFFRFSFPPLAGEVKDRPLFFTLDVIGVTGAPPGHGLGLRFIPDAGQEKAWPYKKLWGYEDGRAWFPNRPEGEGGDLIFRPGYDPLLPDGPVVRRAVRPGWSISDNTFNSFSFKPLPDSKQKGYYFYLTAEEGPGVAPTPMADLADRYKSGRLVLNGVPTEGGLSFRTYHAIRRTEAAGRLLGSIAGHKPGPFGRPIYVILLVAAEIIILGLLLGGLFMRSRKE